MRHGFQQGSALYIDQTLNLARFYVFPPGEWRCIAYTMSTATYRNFIILSRNVKYIFNEIAYMRYVICIHICANKERINYCQSLLSTNHQLLEASPLFLIRPRLSISKFRVHREVPKYLRGSVKYGCTQFCGADNIVFEFRESSGVQEYFDVAYLAVLMKHRPPPLLPLSAFIAIRLYFKTNFADILTARSLSFAWRPSKCRKSKYILHIKLHGEPWIYSVSIVALSGTRKAIYASTNKRVANRVQLLQLP